jgi:hypothetical protein
MAWLVSYVWRRIVVNPDPPLPGRDNKVPDTVAAGAEL